MLRIVYFVGTLEVGGLERFVTRIVLHAIGAGEFQPVVCCLLKRKGPFLTELERAGVKVYEAPEGWMRSPRALIGLRNLMRRLQPDIVHSQVNFSLGQQLLAVRTAGPAAFCVTERSCYRRLGLARVRRVVQFHMLRVFRAKYTANSQEVANHLARMIGLPPTTWPVLPNGVAMIPTDDGKRSEMRSQLGWQPGDVGIGYVARMVPDKGHEAFLHTLRVLHLNGLPIKACLLGDGIKRLHLEQLCQDLELEDVVTFAGTVTNVEDYLQAVDILALFSSREGMPNAILEAMAARKAIVATDVGAIPELLDDGNAGIVVHEPTLDKLVRALTTVVESRGLRDQLGKAAEERVQAMFGLETAYTKLIQFYRDLV